MPVAPRIVHVSAINHDCHFAWQAQYLVSWEGESCSSAYCK